MTVLKTALNPGSGEFKTNAAAMRSLVDDLNDKAGIVARGGDDKAWEKHQSRGKLLPRDRIKTPVRSGFAFPGTVPACRLGHV